MSSEPKKVGRRTFLNYAIAVVATGVIVGAATYFAVPKGEVTVTAPGTTVTKTVTTTVTGTPTTTPPTTTTSPTTTVTTTPYEHTVIEYWSNIEDDVYRKETNPKIIEAVMQENKWIEITYVEKPYGEIRDRLLTACIARNPPHVAVIPIANSPEFVRYAIEITDSIMGKIGVSKDDFWPAALASNMYAGKLYGLPVQNESMAFLWHKELCSKAGIDRPPETWDELADFAKQITDYYHSKGETDVYGYNLVMKYNHGNTMFRFMPVVWAYGGNIVEVTQTGEVKVTVNSQEVIDAVKLYVRMYAKDKSVPPTAFTDTATEGIEYFLRNKIAYVIAHPSNIKYLLNNNFPVEKIGYDLYPKGPVRRASVLGGWNLHIFKDAIKKENQLEAALIFAKYFLNPEWNALWTRGSNPGNRKSFETTTWKELYNKEWWRKAPTSMLQYAIAFPPIPQWSEIGLTVLPQMLQYACSQEKTPEEAVKWAEDKIKEILSR